MSNLISNDGRFANPPPEHHSRYNEFRPNVSSPYAHGSYAGSDLFRGDSGTFCLVWT